MAQTQPTSSNSKSARFFTLDNISRAKKKTHFTGLLRLQIRPNSPFRGQYSMISVPYFGKGALSSGSLRSVAQTHRAWQLTGAQVRNFLTELRPSFPKYGTQIIQDHERNCRTYAVFDFQYKAETMRSFDQAKCDQGQLSMLNPNFVMRFHVRPSKLLFRLTF